MVMGITVWFFPVQRETQWSGERVGEAATSHQPSTQAPGTHFLSGSQGQAPAGKGPSFPGCELGLSTSTHYLEDRINPPGQNNFWMTSVEQVPLLIYVGVRERLTAQ